MKKNHITLSNDRRAVGIGAPRNVSPTIPTRNINGRMFQWNGAQWIPMAPRKPAPKMAPQGWPGILHALFHGMPDGTQGHAAMLPRSIESLGAPRLAGTKANFAVPSGFDQTTAAQSTLDALNAMLNAYANGAPSEHGYSAVAAAFQTAWNADPAVVAAGATASLDVDGGYGPNTHDAAAALNGGSAPAVNTAPAPSGTPTVVTPPSSTSNSIVNYWNSLPTWEQWAIGLAGAGGAVVVGGALYQKHGGKAKAAVRRHAGRLHAGLKKHAASMHSRLRRRHA